MVESKSRGIDISKVTGKSELVKMLAKLRLRSDPAASARGITEDRVDSFSDAEIASLPESTIVHIADAYFVLKKKGVSDQEIFKRIDMQRSLLGQDTAVPAGIDLNQYIKWRLKAEFPQLASLEEMIVDMEILYAVRWFSGMSSGKREWADADAFAAKAISTMRGRYQETPITVEKGVEEMSAEASCGKWKWLAVGFVAIAGAIIYWLLFMGGLETFK